MCREVASRYEERARQKGLQLDLLIVGRPEAMGQPFSARVIIDNLLSNAIRYTDHGAVTICLLDAGIDVIDSGPGIAAGEATYLYERAFRGANAKEAGCGFGLNIVQRPCAYNQWAVRLRNGESGGVVAEFRFAIAPG